MVFTDLDMLMSFVLLMFDLAKIRSRIRLIWHNHKKGHIDVGAAAVATNVASSLARGIIEQYEPLFSQHRHGLLGLILHFFIMLCGREPTPEFVKILEGIVKDGYNDDFYKQADMSYFNAMRLLGLFKATIDQIFPTGNGIGVPDNAFEDYDPRRDGSSMSGSERRQEDESLSGAILLSLTYLSRHFERCPFEDEFLMAMRRFDEEPRQITFSLVFFLQIFLDIHHIMRDAIETSYDSMTKSVTAMTNDMKEYLELHKATAKPSKVQQQNDKYIRLLVNVVECSDTDPSLAMYYATDGSGRATDAAYDRKAREQILKLSPVFCGLWLHYIRGLVYDASMNIFNAWHSVLSAAHLYNSLAHQQLLVGPWADLELVLSKLGDDKHLGWGCATYHS
jgi:hypothetical protein